MADRRIAVVLFNLGGPDCPEAVEPFLFNLFNDSAIIGAPRLIRWALATLVSHKRAPAAREIYAKIGGHSPLLEHTMAQGEALEAKLADLGTVRCFTAMRYWNPLTREAVLEVKAFAPDHVVLLPLYPQFSTATTASSFAAWRREAAREGLAAPTSAVCCYPTAAGLVAAHAGLIRPALEQAATAGPPRLLFSAHGLPKKVVRKGDPYIWQVERTAAAVAEALAGDWPDLDWRVCYQSRVGPLEWVGPSTEDELARAGADGAAVVLSPIAFVSEHSETLVELDIDYARLAADKGVVAYHRVPALGAAERFIGALADLVRESLAGGAAPRAHGGRRLCPAEHGRCAMAEAGGDGR